MTASPQTLTARRSSSEERADRTRELFLAARTSTAEAERRALLNTVIEMHLGYAHAQAGRYRSRGIPLEDLRQVAAMALTKAARGFDVSAGHDFLSYSGPTIRGELRKHFRDHGWMIRPPRRIQELQARINAAEAELARRHGRSPRPEELARHLQVATESVVEALADHGYFTLTSLDESVGGDGRSTTRGELVAGGTNDHSAAEARLVLHPVLRTLDDRDLLILRMRFFEGLTQREIGERLGITQMQISRLLNRILGQLRHHVGEIPAS